MDSAARDNLVAYTAAGDMKLDLREQHTGTFHFPSCHYHELTVAFDRNIVKESLPCEVRDFPATPEKIVERWQFGSTPRVVRGAERMELRYAAQFEPGGLAALLKARQNEEVRAGQSLCGIHREDVELLLDDQPAKVFASQGQQRSVVLSLKVAEAAAAARITGEHPVLLLDDVLSELDEGRKQYLLTRMKEKQTFVTSCDDTAFLKTDGEVYRMNGGVLSKA